MLKHLAAYGAACVLAQHITAPHIEVRTFNDAAECKIWLRERYRPPSAHWSWTSLYKRVVWYDQIFVIGTTPAGDGLVASFPYLKQTMAQQADECWSMTGVRKTELAQVQELNAEGIDDLDDLYALYDANWQRDNTFVFLDRATGHWRRTVSIIDPDRVDWRQAGTTPVTMIYKPGVTPLRFALGPVYSMARTVTRLRKRVTDAEPDDR